MLKFLNIKNLILIESLELSLDNGFNVITGETGAGKSALITALKLLIGHKSDSKVVRKGAEKAVLEALFDIDPDSPIRALLVESGIDLPVEESLLIKREISHTGKSKAYINHQMAQMTLLKKIGDHLIQIVGQHANQRLLKEDEHRTIIDIYGDLIPLLHSYQESWRKLLQTDQQLEALIRGEHQRISEIERCSDELSEIEQANIKEEEEETLFSEYTLLTHAEELSKKTDSICNALHHGEQSVLQQLKKKKILFEALVSIDLSLEETFKCYHNAYLELEEVSHTLNHYLMNLQHDPERADTINQRLTLINKLKRKYGPTVEDIQTHQNTLKIKLDQLKNCDQEIQNLQTQKQALTEHTNGLAETLTQARIKASEEFALAIKNELKDLNMTKVQFIVQIDKQSPSLNGKDKIEFFFAPNIGEHIISVKDSASGGEMSRMNLAIETIMSAKNHVPTIVFDEVDANIGGETALVIGEKLKKIGKHHQILCITHFPQVAEQAQEHFVIKKKEIDGRTISVIEILDPSLKKEELIRMIGGPAKIKK